MAKTATIVHSHLAARNVRPLQGFDAAHYGSLAQLGIDISPRHVSAMIDAIGMDAATFSTTPSITTPVQFLQNWLPGFVAVITAARKIDELVGITTAGAWEDEAIVQGVMELTGSAVPYGDYTNVPFSSWNVNFAERDVVRFEEGMRVGLLEEARSARIKMNSAATKREAATMALEINRNSVGFFGYNGGANSTYGFLNDPNLSAFVQLPNGATSGSPAWSTKTFQDIQKDLRQAFQTLRTSTGEVVDPNKQATTCAIATAVIDYMSTTTDQGVSVWSWLKDAYPLCRFVSAPELNGAHAGSNVFYIYAENLKDMSTDDGAVFMQIVPTKFKTLGVQQNTKSYVEDYSNATAGVWCKRPFAVVRFFGC